MAFKLIQDSTETTTLGYLPDSIAVDETVYALSGTTPDLDPDLGTIQIWTLTANSTPVDTLTDGQSMTLMIDDGSAYSITWPTMNWVGGSTPTLETSGYTVLVLWKVGTSLRGMSAGSVV